MTKWNLLFPKQKDLNKLILSFEYEPEQEKKEITTLSAYSNLLSFQNKKEGEIDSIILKIHDYLLKTDLFNRENGVLEFLIPRIKNPKQEIKRKKKGQKERNRTNKYKTKNPEKIFKDLSEELLYFFFENRAKVHVGYEKYKKIVQSIENLKESRNLFINKNRKDSSSFDSTIERLTSWVEKKVSPSLKERLKSDHEKDLIEKLYKAFRKHEPDKKKLSSRAIYICIAFLFKAFLTGHESEYSTFEMIKKYFIKYPPKSPKP
jgi:hypothetical protein